MNTPVTFLQWAAAALLAAGVAAAAYRLAPLRPRQGWWVLAAVWLLVAAGAWLDMLTGMEADGWVNIDARHHTRAALAWAGFGPGGEAIWSCKGGAVALYGPAMVLTGGWPATLQAVNLLATLLTLVAASQAGAMATGLGERGAWLSMLFCACSLQMLGLAAMPLKEPLALLAVALVALAVVAGRSRAGRLSWQLWAVYAAACVLAALVRKPLLAIVPLGVLLLWPWRKAPLCGAAMLAVAALALLPSLAVKAPTALTPTVYEPWLVTDADPEHAGYNGVLQAWLREWPLWRKLLWLPVAWGVQFLVPLPWTALADLPQGVTLAVAHVGVLWYATGALAGALFVVGWRRAPATLRLLAMWGAAVWAAPAWFTAGSISRYALPALPLLAPAAAWSWAALRGRRAFRIYISAFAALLAVALLAAWTLTSQP